MEPLSRAQFVAAALVLGVASFFAGRATSPARETPPRPATDEPPAVPAGIATRTTEFGARASDASPSGPAADPSAAHRPPTDSASSTGSAARAAAPEVASRPPSARSGVVIRDGGSIFRSRVASTAGRIRGIEGLLLSPRVVEHVEGCPLGMRVEGPPADRLRRQEMLSSLSPYLDDLAAASDAVPEFAPVLKQVRLGLGDALPGPADAAGPAVPGTRLQRVLLVGVPRPDLGEAMTEVCLGLYDHADPHFDRGPEAPPAPGGGHLLVVRLDRFDAETARHALVSGLVEVEVKPDALGGEPSPPASEAAPLVRMLGLVTSHFFGVRGTVRGLYLDEAGSVHWFDETLVPRPLPKDPVLTDALVALLERA